jgi:DNA polymerase-3 subunit delta'
MAFTPELALAYLDKARSRCRLAHAYLVSGLDAAGRRRFAHQLARLLHGSQSSSLEAMAAAGVHLIEPQSKSRQIVIEQIRSLEHVVHQRADPKRPKIGILVEAERMTAQATNAFLKTLEEPPSGSLLLLLTGEPARLLETVRSRCLQITLQEATPESPADRPEADRQLLSALAEHFSRPLAPGRALGFARIYGGLMAGLKSELADDCERERKLEATRYDKTTDAAAWLRQRDDYFEDLAHARYLDRRTYSLGLILRWFGDLLRTRAGHPRRSFPEFATVIEQASTRHDEDDLLRRLRCLDDLQRSYDTNVNEALATELAFLGALG